MCYGKWEREKVMHKSLKEIVPSLGSCWYFTGLESKVQRSGDRRRDKAGVADVQEENLAAARPALSNNRELT